MIHKRPHKNRINGLPDILARTIVDPDTGCRNWQFCKDKDGYGRVRFQGKNVAVHRLVWRLTKGEIPEGVYMLHKCDNPACCNTDHLFLGSNIDNHEDSKAKGRAAIRPGERHHNAKLTDDVVRAIRADTGTQKEIAARFGISRSNVSVVQRGVTWGHVPGAVAEDGRTFKSARGERAASSKLTAAQVLEIRAAERNMSVGDLGRLYGVTASCISAIRHRRTWTHI